MSDRLAFALYRAVVFTVARLSIETVFRIGFALGWLGYYFAGPYRRLVHRNLEIAFGEEKSAAERAWIAHRHFANLGANLFASIKLPMLSREEILRVVEVEGLETLQAGNAAKSGFVMVLAHLGNWEMFAQLSPLVFGCPVGTIFQKLGNDLLDAEVRKNRATLGLQLFERKEGFVLAGRFMRAGGACGVLTDQHAGDAGLWAPFFGRLASTSTLAATLHLRTGSWLVPATVFTAGVGRWKAVILPAIEPRDDDADALTVRINQTVEQLIRRQPEDWFWVHNRWKTPRPKFLLAGYKRGILTGGQTLKPFKIVIRGSNWLGDAVMSAPAVRAIKRGRPDAHVTILTPAKLADFWKTIAEVDEVLPIASGEGVLAVAKKLRAGNFEAAVVFPNSLRTALEPWLAGIPRRVGYPGHHRAKLLNQVLRPKKKKKQTEPPRHQVHHYLALAEFIGADVSDAAVAAERKLEATRTAPRIGLCPGAEYGPAKRWLPERFAEVMRSLHGQRGVEWTLFGVAKDRPIADKIMRAAGVPANDLVGKTSLAELIAELRKCDLLLTNDTGTMHLAASLGVPVVAIFGSTEPSLTGPLGIDGGAEPRGHTIVRRHVECSPCFLRECPIDFRCMKAIESAEVIGAIERALDARPAR